LRSHLGESLATVQKYAVPLEQATTPSLEALKAYSLAYAEANRGSYRPAIQFYERAIALDPDFAVAYAHMGQAYANSGQNSPAVESIKKAFERRSRASELEKLYIETRYHELVTQEADKRVEALELWEKMYPRDPIPHNDLASEYSDMGRYDQALAEAQQALELAPQHITVHILLGVSYMGLDKIAEARAVREKQVSLNLADTWDHVDLYGLAYLENDSASMQREVDWCKGKSDEYILLRTMAARSASAGKMREARELYRQAIEGAKRAGSAGTAKSIAVNLSLMETLAGNSGAMSREELVANATAGGEGAMIAAAHIFALTGDSGRSAGIAEELAKRSPTATYLNKVWVPTLRAEIEISRNNSARAIELLQSPSPYELGWKAQYWPTFVRGLAYLGDGSGRAAAEEFKKVLRHRGVTLGGQLSPLIFSLSQLELARAQAMSGETANAHSSYEKFFSLWKDADPDVPVLQQAKAEYARLQ
jgi:tetratricopeptide (TPR) repeat protein